MANIGLHSQSAGNIESMMIQCHIEMTLIQWYEQLNFFHRFYCTVIHFANIFVRFVLHIELHLSAFIKFLKFVEKNVCNDKLHNFIPKKQIGLVFTSDHENPPHLHDTFFYNKSEKWL